MVGNENNHHFYQFQENIIIKPTICSAFVSLSCMYMNESSLYAVLVAALRG